MSLSRPEMRWGSAMERISNYNIYVGIKQVDGEKSGTLEGALASGETPMYVISHDGSALHYCIADDDQYIMERPTQ